MSSEPKINRAAMEIIADVLCGLALSDHLGDVRDAERDLWKLLGSPELTLEDPCRHSDSAWPATRHRLAILDLIPDYLKGEKIHG